MRTRASSIIIMAITRAPLPTALARATATAAPTPMPTITPTPPPTAAPVAPEERIAFTSDRDGDYEIYAINPDGASVTQLTNNDAGDGRPARSPDGRRIAFTDYPGDVDIIMDDADIYAINADGLEWTQLTDNEHEDISPSWGTAR